MYDLIAAHHWLTASFDPLDEPIEFRTALTGRRGHYVFSGRYEKCTRAVRAATLRNKYDALVLIYTEADAAGGGEASVFTDEQGKQCRFDPTNARINSFYSLHHDTRFGSIEEWLTTISTHFSLNLQIGRAVYDAVYFPHFDAKQSIGEHIRQIARKHAAAMRPERPQAALAAHLTTPPAKKQRRMLPEPPAPALIDALFAHVDRIHALCAGIDAPPAPAAPAALTAEQTRQITEAANAAKTLLVCAQPRLLKRIAIGADSALGADSAECADDVDDADGVESAERAERAASVHACIDVDDDDADAAFWDN